MESLDGSRGRVTRSLQYLLTGVAAIVAACLSANVGGHLAEPAGASEAGKARYFGEEFAAAQQALAANPAEAPAPTF